MAGLPTGDNLVKLLRDASKYQINPATPLNAGMEMLSGVSKDIYDKLRAEYVNTPNAPVASTTTQPATTQPTTTKGLPYDLSNFITSWSQPQNKSELAIKDAVEKTLKESAPQTPAPQIVPGVSAEQLPTTAEQRQTEIQKLANTPGTIPAETLTGLGKTYIPPAGEKIPGYTFTNEDLTKYYGKGLAPASDYEKLMDRVKDLQDRISLGWLTGRAAKSAQVEIESNLALASKMVTNPLEAAQAAQFAAITKLLPETHAQQFAEEMQKIAGKGTTEDDKRYTALMSQMERERQNLRNEGMSDEDIEAKLQTDYGTNYDWVKNYQLSGGSTTGQKAVTHNDVYELAAKSPEGIVLDEKLSTQGNPISRGTVNGRTVYFDKDGNVVFPKK
jgi:hypothetical protein